MNIKIICEENSQIYLYIRVFTTLWKSGGASRGRSLAVAVGIGYM